MRQLRDRRSGARGRARDISVLPLLALALSAGAVRAGEIRGRLLVSDRADKPAGGLTVSAVPWETPGDEARRAMKGGEAPKPIASAVTGADGSFVLAVPSEPGKEKTFRVRVEGAGVVPVLFEDVYDAAETEDLGEHTLPQGERLSGVAVDASGRPLAGAEVSLEAGVAGGDDLAFRVVTRKVVTGEDGKFQFDEASAAREPHHDREGGSRADAADGPQRRRDSEADRGRCGRPGRRRRPRRRPEACRGRARPAGERQGHDALGRDGRGRALHDPARSRRARLDRRRRRRRRLGPQARRQAAARRGQVAHDHARAPGLARRQGRRRQDGAPRAAREGLREGERLRAPRAHGPGRDVPPERHSAPDVPPRRRRGAVRAVGEAGSRARAGRGEDASTSP